MNVLKSIYSVGHFIQTHGDQQACLNLGDFVVLIYLQDGHFYKQSCTTAICNGTFFAVFFHDMVLQALQHAQKPLDFVRQNVNRTKCR